jgi:nucleoside-diphosphate-sugar epimerase
MTLHILVTGGAGDLGSVMVPHLLGLGHRVTVVGALRHGQAPLLDCCVHPGFEFVAGDCRDERVMADLVAQADAVIPLAAIDDAMAGRPYTVGLGDTVLTKRQLCDRIRRHVPGFVFFESTVGEDPDRRDGLVSNARIEATGWRPQ